MIAWREDLRSFLKTESTSSADNATLDSMIARAQAIMESPEGLGRRVEPHAETRYYGEDAVDDNRLTVDADLLEITTLTNGDTTALASATYRLQPRNSWPKFYVDLLTGYVWLFGTDGEISVAGYWGWHKDYTHAWAASGDTVQDNPLTAAATSITITDDVHFKTLQLLKIESELALITEIVPGSPDKLTVTRGVNGSTAAAHVKTTPIYIWTPTADAQQMCLRLAAYLNQQRAAPVFDVTASPEIGVITVPKGLPADVKLWFASNKRYV